MNPEIYTHMAALEDRHWWFRARRAIVAAQVGRLRLPPGSRILDAGCGTGGNLAMLCRHGRVEAMELDEGARELAAGKTTATVRCGKLPDDLPFPSGRFDLVTLLDVLEHVDEDAESLAALSEILKTGGHLVITVPAFNFMWSHHDEVHRHRRRYRLAQLKDKVASAGMEVVYASYFNTLLFPLVAAARLIGRFMPGTGKSGDLSMPTPVLNALLYRVFASERRLLGRLTLPFGVSALVVARKVA